MDLQVLIAEEMNKRRRRARPGGAVLMVLLGLGLSEVQLARQLGVHNSLISIWRRGKRPVAAHWQARLYELLAVCLDSKQATIGLLKRAGAWDQQMAVIVRQKFREAQQIYNKRPAEFRDGGQGETEAAA